MLPCFWPLDGTGNFLRELLLHAVAVCIMTGAMSEELNMQQDVPTVAS